MHNSKNINMRTAFEAQFRFFYLLFLATIFFGHGSIAQEEDSYCEDAISGFRWIRNGSCNIIQELPWPYNQSRSIQPELSQLSHIKQMKLYLEGFYESQLPVELSLLDIVELSIYIRDYSVVKHRDYSPVRHRGTLPSEFSIWTNLQKFQLLTMSYLGWELKENSLLAQFSEWRNLKEFALTYHQISGIIPVQLSTWTKIQRFELNIEGITVPKGTLPQQFSKWTDLRTFSVRSEHIGHLPKEYSTWSNIMSIALDQSELSGYLPIEYSNWQNITSVTLDKNKLFGGVPKQYSAWKQISTLYLSGQSNDRLCAWNSSSSYGYFLEINHTDIDQIPVCTLKSNIVETLLNFKNSTSKPQEVFHNWQGSEPCLWNGIICSEDQIFEIQINTQITAEIPQEFSLISDLTSINLRNAGITGSIPSELSILNIEHFDIANHNIKQAALPVEISTWSDIVVFDVSTQTGQMTGSLPNQYSTWTAIQHFDIGNNLISGTLPVQFSTWLHNIQYSRELEYIYIRLSNNSLSGTVPEQYSAWVSQRQFFSNSSLYLHPQHQNQLCITSFPGGTFNEIFSNTDVEGLPNCFPFEINGTLETEALLEFYKSIEFFDSEFSDLKGDSVCWYVKCFNGSIYSLESRWWEGTASLQPQLSNLQNLYKIEFRDLQFSGSIPPQLSNLLYMREFNLLYNNVSGSLPFELSTWKYIKNFNTNNGLLTGKLPVQYSAWEDVQRFDVGNNQISGLLPEQYSTWQNLKQFSVSNTKLSGKVPKEYSLWKNLVQFNSSNNDLAGTIHKQYSEWDKLRVFDVKNSSLSGTIPSQFSNWQNASYIDTSYNNFTGQVPKELGPLNLSTLSLFPQVNDEIFFVPQDDPDFCVSQYLQGFLVNNISFNLENTKVQNYCDDILLEIGKEVHILQKMISPCYLVQVTCIESAEKTLMRQEDPIPQSFEFYFSSDEKITVFFSNTLQNIQQLFNYNANITDTVPLNFPVIDSDAVLETLILFKKQINESFFNNENNKNNNMLSDSSFQNDYWISFDNIDCDTAQQVTSIKIRRRSIARGNPIFTRISIPPEFSNIKQLQYIVLSGPIVTGTIPVELSVLESLQEFEVRGEVNGSLPAQFSKWKYLKAFRIIPLQGSHSYLTGTLPEQFSTWINIKDFEIGNSSLSGSLPKQFSTWQKRSWINFKVVNNKLTGTLPADYSVWPRQVKINVSGNWLSGTLPKQYSAWSFSNFFVSNNQLTGTLPRQYSVWSFSEFSVSNNRLTGTLPKQYSMWKCSHFSVSSNRLSGTLPFEFSKWTDVEEFDVSRNFFSGSLPKQFSTLGTKNYRVIVRLFDNQFGGQLPSEISEWTNLEEFDASRNSFSGSLPKQFSTLGKEHYNLFSMVVRLFDNHIEGQLPSEFSEWANLKEFDVSRNFLSGSVPNQYSNWWREYVLQVKVGLQQFQGKVCIPSSLKMIFYPKRGNSDASQLPVCNKQKVYELEMEALSVFRNSSLNQNQFDSWKGKTACAFWVGIECFNGHIVSINFDTQLPVQTSIPPEFSELKYLRRIDFHDQLITGTLPPELSILTNMQYFNLQIHELSGTLPIELSMWSNLKQILLGVSFTDGLLTGPLPEQYSTWQVLYRLELFGNQLTGTLPSQLSEWSCSYIILSDNRFSGTVPVQYSTWKRVEYLDGENQTQLDLQNNDHLCILSATYNYLNQLQGGGLFGITICDSMINEYKLQTINYDYSQLKLARSILAEEDWGWGDDVCNNWRYVDCYNSTLTSIANSPLPINDWKQHEALTQFQIPPEISIFRNLVCLGFDGVTGTLPPELSLLEFLEYFEIVVDSNVSLSLPVEYSCWKNIRYFRASRVSGVLPEQYSVWTNLRVFNVGGSNLSGTLPPQYSMWGYKLANMDIWPENLTKSVTDQYSTWQNLEFWRIPENFCIMQGLLSYFLNDVGAIVLRGNPHRGSFLFIEDYWSRCVSKPYP